MRRRHTIRRSPASRWVEEEYPVRSHCQGRSARQRVVGCHDQCSRCGGRASLVGICAGKDQDSRAGLEQGTQSSTGVVYKIAGDQRAVATGAGGHIDLAGFAVQVDAVGEVDLAVGRRRTEGQYTTVGNEAGGAVVQSIVVPNGATPGLMLTMSVPPLAAKPPSPVHCTWAGFVPNERSKVPLDCKTAP